MPAGRRDSPSPTAGGIVSQPAVTRAANARDRTGSPGAEVMTVDESALPVLVALPGMLRRTRQARGMSRAEVGARSWVSAKRVGQLERDTRSPTLHIFCRHARALDLHAGALARALDPAVGEHALAVALATRASRRTLADHALEAARFGAALGALADAQRITSRQLAIRSGVSDHVAEIRAGRKPTSLGLAWRLAVTLQRDCPGPTFDLLVSACAGEPLPDDAPCAAHARTAMRALDPG